MNPAEQSRNLNLDTSHAQTHNTIFVHVIWLTVAPGVHRAGSFNDEVGMPQWRSATLSARMPETSPGFRRRAWHDYKTRLGREYGTDSVAYEKYNGTHTTVDGQGWPTNIDVSL